MQPLAGLTILDLTRLLPGAVATQYFADHGADVIKIEQPGEGDYARVMNPHLFARTNAGKHSVSIDLKHPRGRELLLALAVKADVLIEGFRPGVMARLGLAYPQLHSVNRRLVYVSITGYGQTGPYAGLAGHDINYIALGGLLGLNLPVIPGVQIADLVGGSMQAILGALMALQARHSTGEGQHVDVSMMAGVKSLLAIPASAFEQSGVEPQPGNEFLSGRYACYNIYQAGDGRWLAVGALEPKFWATLCRALDCQDLIELQFDNERQAEMKARVAAVFAQRAAREWFETLRHLDCCATPVLTIGEACQDQRREWPPYPRLGEHTDELLIRAGIVISEINHLRRQGVVQ